MNEQSKVGKSVKTQREERNFFFFRRSPLLLHLLEGPGPPVAAVRDFLDLLPLLLLLHHVGVDATPPALPLAQVLQREQSQRGACITVHDALEHTGCCVGQTQVREEEEEEESERGGGEGRAAFEGVLFVSCRLLLVHLPCVLGDLNAALYCTGTPLFYRAGNRTKCDEAELGNLFFLVFFSPPTLIFPAVSQQLVASQSGTQLLLEHFFSRNNLRLRVKMSMYQPGLFLPPQHQLSTLHHETI